MSAFVAFCPYGASSSLPHVDKSSFHTYRMRFVRSRPSTEGLSLTSSSFTSGSTFRTSFFRRQPLPHRPFRWEPKNTISADETANPPSPSQSLPSQEQELIIPQIEAPQAHINFGSHRMRVFAGSSNPDLAKDIAHYVGKTGPSAMMRKRFSDGETYVRIDESVRGCNVFLIQGTSFPTNDNLIELLLMIDACRRASAHQITAVIPYYGYARADRLIDPDRRRREALTSKLVANMLSTAGTDRIVLVDIHSPQTCGFFDIPVDHVYASSVLEKYVRAKGLNDIVVVAPDVGGVARARAFAKGVNDSPLAIIDKRRDGHNVAKVLNLVGDVKDRTAILVDDMIDTAGTICEAAKMLRERGARQVFACSTHAIFSGPAIDRLSSGVFEEVIVTNSIAVPPEKRFEQLTILSIAELLGEQVWRVHEQSSR
ncbi:Ribose-phosphate pyrophosphokinase [Gracilariopsis chorda]|uniref:ribose-phosphate diphosphokinase n=1 Tax=Gracilariopsis chorda TaxID=448386 RepID=A0A2V3J297_9FLOR|nr:Ribose-phosphate pyrophosphokinase [Gracilariopsis chorda]|eukprot:PXF48518.1 Ribose-phosphate pyrophosphokinase [Gracilariopsis chorda]